MLCLLLLWIGPGPPGAVLRAQIDEQGPRSEPDLHTLAANLVDAPEVLRADFARAALFELILVYRREAQRARTEGLRGATNRERVRWSRAVDGLVADLQRLSDSLTPETPVSVSAPGAGSVLLVVGGMPVLLSGPRSGGKAALERRVLQRFCNRNECDEWLRTESAAMRPAVSPELTLWRFADAAGPVCATGDGLEFQFQSTSNLHTKREACRRIVAELNAMAYALGRKIDGGTPVDWNRLALYSAPGTPLQRIVFNAGGDYLLLSAPTLGRSRRLFQLVLPWVAAKVAGKRYNLVILNTERLLELPDHPPQ